VSLPQVRRYRGFFWPAVLILVGVIAFLANAGLISTDRLALLVDLWPLVLIVIGLEIIARRGLQGAAGDVAAVLIVLIAAGGAIAYVALAPNPGTTHTLDASAPLGSLGHAAVEVDVGAATITMSGDSSLEGKLYQAHIVYSGRKPDVSLDRSNGTLNISQGNNGFAFQARHFTLDLQLNSSIPWSITSDGGASTETYKLGAVHVSSMDINTGASREEITLGPPSGAVPITINGGALTVHIHRPAGVGATVTVSGGAISLDFDGHQQHAIGSLGDSASTGPDTYRVEVNGGACTVTIDTAAASA
jgi:cell wall-active antibiotic response 4TMS protein YvqF